VETMNVMIAGVGGQGLLLTTKIICEAAFKAGYDFKSNDVIGLSQRGGKVWGSVRFGDKVHSPNISLGEGHVLIAFEPLEALRWKDYLRQGGRVIMNLSQIPPVPVIHEEETYPDDIQARLSQSFEVTALDTNQLAADMGTIKVSNILLIGLAAQYLPIDKQFWLEAISENVPKKFLKENSMAFEWGYTYVKT